MIPRKLHSTVCIVGAGPAGAATSIFLSKLGIEHIIVDAATFPRDKVCGDGIDIKAVRMLNHIDPSIIPNELLQSDKYTPSFGFRFIGSNGKNNDFIYTPKAGEESRVPFFVSKRIHFDDFLIKKIDLKTADFRQATKVKTISKEGDTWKLIATDNDGELEITCKLLVGADGDHSTVLRYLGDRKINRLHYFSSIRQYWKGVEGMHEKNLLEIHFTNDLPMSYFWIFPLANGEANVGFGMTSELAKKHKVNVREAFKNIIANDSAIAHRFKNAEPIDEIEGWGIPAASLKRKVVGDGWLLVGDAASMVCPTTGEGIGTGMMTGYIAAKFIEKGIKENNFSEANLSSYTREVFKRIEPEISKYNFSLKYPFVLNFIANHLIKDNFICRSLMKKEFARWITTCYDKEVIVDVS